LSGGEVTRGRTDKTRGSSRGKDTSGGHRGKNRFSFKVKKGKKLEVEKKGLKLMEKVKEMGKRENGELG